MSDRDHPSPSALLKHFLSTAGDYEALAVAVPLPRSVNLSKPVDEVTRWNTALHAMLLRKYFERDRLDVRKVVDALRACAKDDLIAPERWQWLRDFVATPEDVVLHHFGDDPEGYTDGDLATANLYGRLLHGDYAKWKTTELARGGGLDVAVLWATIDRARRLTALVGVVRDGIERGDTILTE